MKHCLGNIIGQIPQQWFQPSA